MDAPRYNRARIRCGPLAQWLEQATHNRLVVGSNPTGATIYQFGVVSVSTQTLSNHKVTKTAKTGLDPVSIGWSLVRVNFWG